MIDLRLGDCLEVMKSIPAGSIDAVITDPPYGMNWDTDSTRFTGGVKQEMRRGAGRSDWGAIIQDDEPFDPSPWLDFPKVILWGANHFAQRLPKGTTLVWIKKADHLFNSFLSDAEIAWMKGGYGVYCFRKQFPPPSRMAEGNGKVLHPNQKPLSLMRWCLNIAKVTAGMTVLDPYMGSATLGVACLQAGVNYIGIEKDPLHFATSQNRIHAAQMQPNLFE